VKEIVFNATEVASPEGEILSGATTLVVENNLTKVTSPKKSNKLTTLAAEQSETENTTKVVSPKSKTISGAATLVAEEESSANATEVASPKRNLPHVDLIGYYQFLTFRTYDSIDDYLTRLSSENISTSLKQYKADAYLDNSQKGAYLNGDILEYLKQFLMEKDGELYELVAFSVMPNHLHILFKQKMEIAKTVQQLKGASSFDINKILQRKGSFWEKSYFDKAIRDEAHFDTVYNYIKYNAVKANLSDAKERFYGIYE